MDYSSRNASTGFATAARMACQLTVSNAIAFGRTFIVSRIFQQDVRYQLVSLWSPFMIAIVTVVESDIPIDKQSACNSDAQPDNVQGRILRIPP